MLVKTKKLILLKATINKNNRLQLIWISSSITHKKYAFTIKHYV